MANLPKQFELARRIAQVVKFDEFDEVANVQAIRQMCVKLNIQQALQELEEHKNAHHGQMLALCLGAEAALGITVAKNVRQDMLNKRLKDEIDKLDLLEAKKKTGLKKKRDGTVAAPPDWAAFAQMQIADPELPPLPPMTRQEQHLMSDDEAAGGSVTPFEEEFGILNEADLLFWEQFAAGKEPVQQPAEQFAAGKEPVQQPADDLIEEMHQPAKNIQQATTSLVLPVHRPTEPRGPRFPKVVPEKYIKPSGDLFPHMPRMELLFEEQSLLQQQILPRFKVVAFPGCKRKAEPQKQPPQARDAVVAAADATPMSPAIEPIAAEASPTIQQIAADEPLSPTIGPIAPTIQQIAADAADEPIADAPVSSSEVVRATSGMLNERMEFIEKLRKTRRNQPLSVEDLTPLPHDRINMTITVMLLGHLQQAKIATVTLDPRGYVENVILN